MPESQLDLWDDDPDNAAGWQSPPAGQSHEDAVRDFLWGVLALHAEMGDLLPESVRAYARELRRATRCLDDGQRAQATQQMRGIHNSADGYQPRALLVVALSVALASSDATP
jgi:hypothetical protein